MINYGENMDDLMTTICEGTHGQLLITFPKQVARVHKIFKGDNIKWDCDNGKITAEVLK